MVDQTRLDLTSFRGPDESVDQTRLDLTSFRGPDEMVDQTRLNSTQFHMHKCVWKKNNNHSKIL